MRAVLSLSLITEASVLLNMDGSDSIIRGNHCFIIMALLHKTLLLLTKSNYLHNLFIHVNHVRYNVIRKYYISQNYD